MAIAHGTRLGRYEIVCSIGSGGISQKSDIYAIDLATAAADQALYRAKRNGRNRVEGERRRAPRATTPGMSQARLQA